MKSVIRGYLDGFGSVLSISPSVRLVERYATRTPTGKIVASRFARVGRHFEVAVKEYARVEGKGKTTR